MPDFERMIDSLRLQKASSAEEKAQVKGYIKGKSRARVEVALIAFVCALGYVVISPWVQEFRSSAKAQIKIAGKSNQGPGHPSRTSREARVKTLMTDVDSFPSH